MKSQIWANVDTIPIFSSSNFDNSLEKIYIALLKYFAKKRWNLLSIGQMIVEI